MPLDFWYPGGLGRYARFKILHPQASNQSSVYISKPDRVPRAQLKVLWSQKTRIWRQPWNSIRFCKHPAIPHKKLIWKAAFFFLSNPSLAITMRPVVWHLFFYSKPILHSKSLHQRICKIQKKDKIFFHCISKSSICYMV